MYPSIELILKGGSSSALFGQRFSYNQDYNALLEFADFQTRRTKTAKFLLINQANTPFLVLKTKKYADLYFTKILANNTIGWFTDYLQPWTKFKRLT